MKNLSFLTSNLIAHRGVHYLFKENTLSAFQQAIEQNYTIELDVHLSKDEEIVAFHDYSLNRLYKINQLIKDLTLKDLRKYHVPTLEEVLKLVSGQVPLIIETKVPSKILYEKITKLLDNYQGYFAIQSFYPQTILYFKKTRPNYVRGYLFYNPAKLSFITRIIFDYRILSFILKPNFIGINLTSLKINKIQNLRNKYIVIGYTIKTENQYLNYLNYADNFICDIPKCGLKK